MTTNIEQYPEPTIGPAVDSTFVEYVSDRVVLLRVSLNMVVTIVSVGTSDGVPNVTVEALEVNVRKDTVREISFPEYRGYTVFSADKGSRSLINIAMTKLP